MFWLILLGVLGLVAYSIIQGKKRRQALQQLAQQMGFTWAARGSFLAMNYHQLTIGMETGSRVENLMQGSANGFETIVCDYTYTTGHGDDRRDTKQTIAVHRLPGSALPVFNLGPDQGRLAKLFGYKDFDFDSNPEFSKRFCLRGQDEAAVRALFTPALMTFFESLPEKKKLNVQGAGEWISVYTDGKTVKAEDLQNFLMESAQIAGQFRGMARAAGA